MLTFILGGARSGKSRRAQSLAEATAAATGAHLVFIATAQPFDVEMRERIERHRSDRDGRWRTVEAPTELPAVIREITGPDKVVLIDCLTLWLTNIMLGESDAGAASEDLMAALAEAPCAVFVVSNEVGLGIVPDNVLARQFRDVAGRLHQQVAAAADRVEWMVAGLSLQMK